jgi:hypothetical protein
LGERPFPGLDHSYRHEGLRREVFDLRDGGPGLNSINNLFPSSLTLKQNKPELLCLESIIKLGSKAGRNPSGAPSTYPTKAASLVFKSWISLKKLAKNTLTNLSSAYTSFD